MQGFHERCAGLDVHKKSAYACVIWREAEGKKRQQVRSFGTMTADLLELADWLHEHGVSHVTMEATGVYWCPVWAVLQGEFELMLVDPHHIKAIPGRKTDTKDCEWIADLAELYGIPVCAHNVASPLGSLASAHCAAAIRDFRAQEFHPGNMPNSDAWEKVVAYDGPVIKDGKYRISDKPGLGVELNEDYVRGHLMPGEAWWG